MQMYSHLKLAAFKNLGRGCGMGIDRRISQFICIATLVLELTRSLITFNRANEKDGYTTI